MKYLLGFLLLLLSARVSAQNFQEFPEQAGLKTPAGTSRLLLAAPNIDSLSADDLFRAKNGDFYRIGVGTTVAVSPQNAGTWEQLADGHSRWTLTITSPQAKGLSFVFSRFVLDQSSTFSVIDDSGKPVTDILTASDNQDHGMQHIALCEGASLTLVLTTAARGSDQIQLDRVFHLYRGLHGSEKDYGDAESCEVNVNCSPAGDDWQDEKRGIARVLLVLDSETGYCTGSLVNNLGHDCKPYFLTAQHCGSGATANDFNQWKFYFNYESSGCNNSNPGLSSLKRIDGCVLISNSLGVTSQSITSSDFLLLQLGTLATENAVIAKLKSPNINAYWNGWDANNVSVYGGAGIHHPAGDLKKISTFTGATVSTNYSPGAYNTHWRVQWSANANGFGVTETGSSGSPVFNFNGGNSRIIGTLSGGEADCSAQTAPDLYGKFSYDWTSNGSTADRQLKPFLDPFNTGILVMDGSSDPCEELQADFSATPTTQTPGGTIVFTDLSTGSPASWHWTITPSTGWTYTSGTSQYYQNPQVVFTDLGQYTVKLVVADGYSMDSLTRQNYITITLATGPCVATSTECDEFIAEVELNTLEQNSECDNYTAYANGTTLNIGSSYFLTVLPQIGSSPGIAYNGDEIAAWIDYNGDYDFNDPDEQIAFLHISGTFNPVFQFTVPYSALPGTHTLRVRIAYNSDSTPVSPCGTTEYGEVEDYTIIIAEQLGLDDPAVNAFSLFPNPAATSVTVDPADLSGNLRITDVRGVLMAELPVDHQTKIDLSAYPTGIYYFEFLSEHASVVRKLVKL